MGVYIIIISQARPLKIKRQKKSSVINNFPEGTPSKRYLYRNDRTLLKYNKCAEDATETGD